MFAIASLFDLHANALTWALWNRLEEGCGLAGIKATPYPHFSWLSYEDMDWKAVRTKLGDVSTTEKPFQVQTAGLGLFTGARPILYIALVKTPQLLSIQRKIWRNVKPALVHPNPYYSPQRWMPHITLAYGDLNSENLPCALRNLLNEPLDFGMEINNISVIFQTEFAVGIKEEFLLAG